MKAALAGQPGLTFVVQEPQLGTGARAADDRAGPRGRDGHAGPAVRRRAAAVGANAANAGRSPHIRPAPRRPWSPRSSTTPHGYGRIVRRPASRLHVLSRRDATPAEREIREINSGIYAFALDGLFDAVRSIAARERAERVLPAGSRGDLPAARAWRRNRDRRESRRDSGHQQPRRAGGSEPNRETSRRTPS